MTYPFHIAHTTHGRTRIRWAGNPADRAVIDEIARQITDLEEVDRATPRIDTGSIIIEHEQAEWSTLAALLADSLKLEFTTPATVKTRTGLETINKGLAQVDGTLKEMNTDLRSVTVFMLSALAITQALRGQVMVSSASLLWYAFSIATKARDSADTSAADTAADAAGDSGE